MPKTDLSKNEKYFYSVGKRKTAVAKVKIYAIKKKSVKKSVEENETEDKKTKTPQDINVKVNGKSYIDYFKIDEYIYIVAQPLKLVNVIDDYRVEASVKGSGIGAQAEAVRLGISKALLKADAKLKDQLKPAGLLKRDPRMVESKKAGKPKARRSKQWSKR